MAMTWASALGWRLGRHHLDTGRATSIEAVVQRLVAVPARAGDARTSIRLRLAPAADGDLDAAIAEGRVLTTYAFRGATHLMTPASAADHLALRCAGRQWELPSWRTYYDLEPKDWPGLRATVRDALRDGPLTQHELALAVTRHPAYRHLLTAFEDSSHTILKPFAWQGDLCFSPSPGPPTFRLLESVPGWAGPVELDDAGPRAIRAYLAGYGPATRDRIHYWLGDGLSAGRRNIDRWIERIDAELADVVIEGADALCLAEHADAVVRAAESDQVVLLPGSDQWILGAGTSDTHIVPAEHRPLATRGAQLVLVGGHVRGTWKITHSSIRVTWIDGVRAADHSSAVVAADRLAIALGRELELWDR